MNPGQQHRYLLALLALHLLLAVGYSILVPLGEGPDEVDHWAYTLYLIEHRRLPIGPKLTQSKHPPLYHMGAALFAWPAKPTFAFLRANPDMQIPPPPDVPNFFIHTTQESWPWRGGALGFHLARFWSVLLSTATVAATYALMQCAFPKNGPWIMATTGVLALLPQFSFMGGMINNDNGAALTGTVALWGALVVYQARGKVTAAPWLPVVLGCGLLAKSSTLAIWPVVGAAILLGAFAPNDGGPSAVAARWRRFLMASLLTFGLALALASPWLLRNWLLYGDPLGLALTRQTIDLRLAPWTWADTRWLLRGWFVTFWGRFGVIGHLALPDGLYRLLALLSLLSGVGLLKGWWRTPASGTRPILGLFLLAVLGTILVIWQYSLLALGTDQGRLLYPAVAPLVALWVGGLLAWAPGRWQWLSAHLLNGFFLALALYALLGVVQPAFAPPAPVAPSVLTNSTPVVPLAFGDLILANWQLTETPILYWQARRPLATDLRVILRVVAEDGALIWEWRRSPGGGQWSTDHWPPGVIVRDQYTIRWPDWVQAGRYRVEVGVQPFAGDWLLPQRNDQPATNDGYSFVALGWLAYQP